MDKVQLNALEEFEIGYPLQIVITSRLTKDVLREDVLSDYARWLIQPFNFTQIRNFIQKWFHDREESSDRLLAAIEDHHLLARLPQTPLVLTLLAIIFDSDDYTEIPANLSELYQMFLDLLLGKWSLDRTVNTLYEAPIRQFIATELAAEMHDNGLTAISRERFDEVIVRCETTLAISLDSDVLFKDFVEETALLIENDRGDLEFRHLSFQEFLTALHIYEDEGETEPNKLMDRALENIWWAQVMYFYFGLRRKNTKALQEFIKKVHTKEQYQQTFALLQFGYLVQASYLTPADVRKTTIKEAIKTFYRAIDRMPKLNVYGHEIPEGVIFITFTLLLSLHYSSRFLSQMYTEIFKEEFSQTDLPEHQYLLLALATFLGEIDDTSAFVELANLVDRMKENPKIYLAFSQLGEIALEVTGNDDLKKIVNKSKKWLGRRPDIVHRFLKSSEDSQVNT